MTTTRLEPRSRTNVRPTRVWPEPGQCKLVSARHLDPACGRVLHQVPRPHGQPVRVARTRHDVVVLEAQAVGPRGSRPPEGVPRAVLRAALHDGAQVSGAGAVPE